MVVPSVRDLQMGREKRAGGRNVWYVVIPLKRGQVGHLEWQPEAYMQLAHPAPSRRPGGSCPALSLLIRLAQSFWRL